MWDILPLESGYLYPNVYDNKGGLSTIPSCGI